MVMQSHSDDRGSYTGHVLEMASNLIDATLINLISQTGAGIPLDLV